MSLRVAFVSTYPPQRCGIAAYTQMLARALVDGGAAEPIVLAEHGARRGMDGRVRVEPVFHRGDSAWPETIAAAAHDARADVVHVQYGTDIFGLDDRLPRLCGALARMSIPSVATLHTILPRATALAILRWHAGRFYRALAATARIVVHQRAGQLDVLLGYGVPTAATAVIPHGTPAPLRVDRRAARSAFPKRHRCSSVSASSIP